MRVQACLAAELCHGALADEAAAQVFQDHRLGSDPRLGGSGGQPLSHRAVLKAVLQHQQPPSAAEGVQHRLRIQGSDGVEFDDLGGHAPLREQVCRRQDLVDQNAVGDQGHVRPPAQNSGGTAVPVREGAYLPAPGIADGHRAVHGQGGPEHGPQLLEGGGAQHGEAGDLGEKPHVLTAVVGGAVGPHQAGPVHRQHHVEALESHIVDEHIVAPL